ncbi:Gfo/Idh/MocA family oxidoreductase [Sphingomonas sp. C3-2]|uniref:Gfo/Idh/MocA family protein n=1 Tax=Sphingomonas sp. C3-2 TaxID=3062169 RepID=UPI00294B6F75|nr:Gfo/Idh/MocA family oxidoreductase [Sphingomonas sp. C3-2]WOK35104.1 Gfo/Idh/MocA family oxidoreductase [Sphingomonas sp. C3-2]
MIEATSEPRFVVASLGSIGQRHLRNLRQLRPNALIAALRRPGGGTETFEGCDALFTSIEQALPFQPVAAILAGPATTHIELAQAFVERGISVLIEKPLSADLHGLARLSETAQAQGTPIMIGYNLRFNASLASMRADLQAGAIGDVLSVRAEVGQYLPDWRPGSDYRQNVSAQRSLGGGALLELSHEIDYIYWLFGMPERVTCRGGRLSDLDIDVEDCVELCLEYSSPPRLVSIHLDFLQRPAIRTCKLVGSRGTMLWNALEDSYAVNVAEAAPDRRIVHKPMHDRNQMYLDELSAFLAAAENRHPTPIPLAEGIDVMRIITAARRSLESGRAEQPIAITTSA